MSQVRPENPSEEPTLATGPVLSFKKRQNKTPPMLKPQNSTTNNDKTPTLNSPDTPVSAPGTPTLGGSGRKVLNRRKALQDFYKMNAVSSTSENANLDKTFETAEPDASEAKIPQFDAEELLHKLSNEKDMREFIKTANALEILRARNAAADKLNLHDLERKSIIYNNYSELIKLNQILADVFDEKRDVSEFGHAEDGATVTHKSIDEYLADLSGFLANDAAVFNQDFPNVVKSLCLDIDGADSVSSVAGISGRD